MARSREVAADEVGGEGEGEGTAATAGTMDGAWGEEVVDAAGEGQGRGRGRGRTPRWNSLTLRRPPGERPGGLRRPRKPPPPPPPLEPSAPHPSRTVLAQSPGEVVVKGFRPATKTKNLREKVSGMDGPPLRRLMRRASCVFSLLG